MRPVASPSHSAGMVASAAVASPSVLGDSEGEWEPDDSSGNVSKLVPTCKLSPSDTGVAIRTAPPSTRTKTTSSESSDRFERDKLGRGELGCSVVSDAIVSPHRHRDECTDHKKKTFSNLVQRLHQHSIAFLFDIFMIFVCL
eukprot:scpid55021/ scgid27842/ 